MGDIGWDGLAAPGVTLPPASLTPVSLSPPQVEAVISEHRAELLAERYRFNMGLLMGECGAPGQPLPGSPAPPHPASQPFAMGFPSHGSCIAVLRLPAAGEMSCHVPNTGRAAGGSCLQCPVPGTALGQGLPPAAGSPGLHCAPRPPGALFTGEARSRLRWADGKTIKNEVDLQVGVRAGVRHCLAWCPTLVPCLLWDLLAWPVGGPGAENSCPL